MASGTRAGGIYLDLNINKKGFQTQLGGIQKMAAKAGAAIAGAFAVTKLVQFGKECIDLGSDLAEVQNVVDVTFPTMQKTIDNFAQNAAKKFGLSETMAKRFTGTFGSMAEAFGFNEKQAADMAKTLTGLAGDVASFYNISQDEAYTKLKSVFSGETESLKDLGVVMTQTALDQYALANGFGKTTSAMTEAEKVSLRYAFVQQQLTNAAGDFARTSDSWANQVRILALQFDSLKAAIGQGLINVFKPVLMWLNTIIERLVTAARAFANFTGMFSKSGKESANWTKSVSNGLSSASASAGNLGTSAGKASKSLGSAAKQAKKLKRELAGFDQITKLSEPENSSSGSTGSGTGNTGGGISTDSGMPDATSQIDDTNKKTLKLNVNFDNLKKSVARLKESFGAFTDVLKGGFKWAWENILKPLGKWTVEKLAPKLIDVLSAAFDVLTAALNALKPYAKWVWDKFLSKIARFAGDAIIKFLGMFADGLEKLSGWIEKHPKAFDAIVTGIVSILAAVKTGKAISDFTKRFNTFVDIFKKVKGTKDIAELSKGIGGFGSKLIKTKGCLKDFGGWFKNAMSGFKAHRKGIISFKTLFSGLFPNVSKTLGNITGAFKKFGTSLKGFTGKITNVGKTIGSFAKNLGSSALNGIKNAGKAIGSFAKTFGAGIKNVFSSIGGALKGFGGKVGKLGVKVGKAFLKIGKTIGGLIAANPVLFAVIAAIAAAIAIGVLLYKNWDKIKKKLEPLIKAFKNFGKTIKNIFKGIPDFFKNIFKKAKEKILEPFKKIGEWFQERYDDICNVFSGIKDFFAEKFTGALENLKDNIPDLSELGEKISEKIGEVKAKVSAWFSDKKETLTNTWNELTGNIKEKCVEMAAKIVQKWSDLKKKWAAIADNIKSKTAEMKAKIASKWSDLKKKWAAIANNIKSRTAYMKARVASKWSDLKEKWNSLMGHFKDKTVSLALKFSAAAQDLKGWINTHVIDRVNNKFKNVPILKNHLIPPLAQGGFVKKNTPQLAMIGDNRHQGEVVAPEDKLLEMARQAAAMSGGNNDAEIVSLLKQILIAISNLNLTATVDVNALKKLIVKLINDRTRATGVCEIDI